MRRLSLLFLLSICLTLVSQAQYKPSRYDQDLRNFRKQDSLQPPGKGNILFIGSSSFTMWTDVNDYFPGYHIINRAYGGSCLTDLINDFQSLVVPYDPRQVVIYCGENDFASDTALAPQTLVERFIMIHSMIRGSYPEAFITYVSMKPSPSRWHMKDKFIEANGVIKQYIAKQPQSSFIDVWGKMLDVTGHPDPAIFLEDQLHMNAAGYRIWQEEIRKHLRL